MADQNVTDRRPRQGLHQPDVLLTGDTEHIADAFVLQATHDEFGNLLSWTGHAVNHKGPWAFFDASPPSSTAKEPGCAHSVFDHGVQPRSTASAKLEGLDTVGPIEPVRPDSRASRRPTSSPCRPTGSSRWPFRCITRGGPSPCGPFGQTVLEGKATVSIALSTAVPSSLILPVVPGVQAPTPLPASPSLRNEPCRPYQSIVNEGGTQ